MPSLIRIKSLKELRFRKPDGTEVSLEIPQNLNQTLLNKAIRNDYLVMTVAVGRSIAESEVCTLKSGNSTVGFLIPGQTILSPDQQLNSDRLFGTYSLITALKVCENSLSGNYDLSPYAMMGSESAIKIFHEDIFYLVVWLKKLDVTAKDFANEYFVSLARHGVIPSADGKKPLKTQRTLDTYDEIRISKNSKWPDYIRTIISELEPYATDPFLRFFYLYQIIETLMSGNYKAELAKIRPVFEAHTDISITQLREYVEKFQKIYKEKSRINDALKPTCPRCKTSAEAILNKLGEECDKDSFGELIYKVRNIVFHDYQRIHPFAAQISDLEDNLASYILDQKLAQ